MNRTPEEKLFDHLSEIDPALLDEAMELNSAEKLQEKVKTVPFTKGPLFRWTAAIAACLAIVLCILPLLQNTTPPPGGEQPNTPPMLYDPTWPTWPTNPSQPITPSIPSESLDPPWITAGTNISIESADMLNYYSAIYLLAQQNTVNFTSAGSNSGYGLTLLDTLDTTEPPANTESPQVNPPADPTVPPYTEDDYYEYPIDPNAQFHLTQVIFFRFNLTGDGFLAQTLGTGIVDAVITDFDIFGDYLITFKNGDKYFSCLTNGYSPSEFEFSTHKYIKDFNVVKNGRQTNYRFAVNLNGNMQVDHFECDYFDYFAPDNNPDGVLPVVGETYIADTDLTFTIDQLETYFQNIQFPTQTEQ